MAYEGPSGRVGKPDDAGDYVTLQADELTLYVARDILGGLKPDEAKLLVGVSGYGRYWLHLLREPEADSADGTEEWTP